ncbi:hypothetical protein GQ600_12195 [Phytophthora cactorum]|nr:hypothetical protein GQ600_12195 [Phytophthora cactorum]
MSKLKSKTQNLDELKQIIIRDLEMSNDRLSKATMELYLRQLLRLFKSGKESLQWDPKEFIDRIQYPTKYDDTNFQRVFGVQNSDMIALLMRLYKSKESLILTLNALCKMVKNCFRDAFGYYNAVRKELSKQNKSEKLDNELTPEEEKKYISYQELMSVPQKVKKIIMDAYGEVFLSNNELTKRLAYLRLVFDYITLYLNVHYPLRLVWPTVYLRKVDGGNYLQGIKLYLNDFKNVRLMGPQVIELDGSTMNLIARFLHFLSDSLGQTPTKLLWRVYNNSPGEYDNNSGFSSTISKIFVKYNGKPMSMNMIRHIVESHLIQSPTYAKLTNREKHDLHAKLLHSTFAANTSYNKIANRSTAPEVAEEAPDFSFEPTPEPQSPSKAKTRSKGRRERIFHGDFTPTGSDKSLEIEIFEK